MNTKKYGISTFDGSSTIDIKFSQNSIYGSVTFKALNNRKIVKVIRQEKDDEEEIILFKNTSSPMETFTDLTCENANIYKYTIFLSGDNNDTAYIFDNIEVNFEDIVLCDAESYNLVRFNPNLSSIKINQSETITPTLGGRYPVVRRNAATNYYSCSLSGLISIRAENDDCELTYPTIDEYYQELGYRKQFIEFLTNGKTKLFKSPTEGAMLVRVTGVNLTPESKLSRKIYSFSATITEVAEMTPANCIKYNIYSLSAVGTQFVTNKGIPFYVKQEE